MEAKQAVLLYAERETWVYDLGHGLWGEDLGGACPRELLERMQNARIDWAWDRESLIQCVMRQMYQLIILIFDPEKSLTVEKWEEIQKLRKFSNSKPTHIWLLAARSPASSMARREMWIQKLWEWESATPKDIGIALRRLTEKVFLYLPDADGKPRRFEEKRIVSIEAIQGRHCIYYMDTDKKIVERVLLAYRINLIQKALEEIKRVGASPFVRISRSVIVNIWHIVKMEECENKTGIIWVTGNTSEALRPLHLSRRMGERLYEMIGKQKGSLPDKLHV